MEGGALLDPKFKDFSKNHVMFLSIETRITDRKHDTLLQEKGFRGFPSFAVLFPLEGRCRIRPASRGGGRRIQEPF